MLVGIRSEKSVEPLLRKLDSGSISYDDPQVELSAKRVMRKGGALGAHSGPLAITRRANTQHPVGHSNARNSRLVQNAGRRALLPSHLPSRIDDCGD
jgi:hypothetical protein